VDPAAIPSLAALPSLSSSTWISSNNQQGRRSLVAVRLEISRFDQRRWQCSRIAGRRPWQCKEDEGLKEKRKMGTWR